MWYWWVGAFVVWLVSASCIIGTMVEMRMGKYGWRAGPFWGAVVFHGATAILALWLFVKAILG